MSSSVPRRSRRALVIDLYRGLFSAISSNTSTPICTQTQPCQNNRTCEVLLSGRCRILRAAAAAGGRFRLDLGCDLRGRLVLLGGVRHASLGQHRHS